MYYRIIICYYAWIWIIKILKDYIYFKFLQQDFLKLIFTIYSNFVKINKLSSILIAILQTLKSNI